MVVTEGAGFVKMSRKILAQHFAATPFGALNLLVDARVLCVLPSIPQVTLPQTSSLKIGALHFKATQSSSVEVVWSCGEVFTIDGALFDAFNALPTEQVPTSGLHWVRDQFQTDGAL